jgi:hypothetical protein
MRLSRIRRLPWLCPAAIPSISPIGFIAGEPVYPVCGAEGEGGSGGDGGDDGSSGGDGGDGDGDKGGDGDKDDKPPKDPEQYAAWVRVRDLSRENANKRIKNKELTEQLDMAQKELEALRAKDMSNLERANTQVAKLTKTTEEQAASLDEARIKIAFLELPRDKYNWHNPGAALTLLMAEHRSELTLNDDGTVDGMDNAVKALAKTNKFLLVTAANSGGSGGDGDGGDGKGSSTGGSYGNNGDRGSGDARKAFQDKAASRFRL